MCIGYTQILCHIVQGTGASMDIGIHASSGTNPPGILRNSYNGELTSGLSQVSYLTFCTLFIVIMYSL